MAGNEGDDFDFFRGCIAALILGIPLWGLIAFIVYELYEVLK